MSGTADRVGELLDIESIKRMRARCARLLDTERWQDWGMTFTTDAVLDVPDAGLRSQGRAAIVEWRISLLRLERLRIDD